MARFLNGLRQTLEILIIIVMLISGVSLFFVVTVSGTGPVATLLGSHSAGIVYGTVFCSEALLLLYAKIRLKKRLHGKMLYIIWLTLVFTVFLEFLIIGWSWSLLDNIIASVASAFCWLRWKFLTEYLNPGEVYKKTVPFRDDLP